MNKSHSLGNMRRKFQRKEPKSISSWDLTLLLGFVFMILVGLPILTVVVVAFPPATSPPVNWKVGLPFLVLFIGWWFYALLRGVPARVAQILAKKKLRMHKVLRTPNRPQY